MVSRIFNSATSFKSTTLQPKNFQRMSSLVADYFRETHKTIEKIVESEQKNIPISFKKEVTVELDSTVTSKTQDCTEEFLNSIVKIPVGNSQQLLAQSFSLLKPHIPSVLESLIKSRQFLDSNISSLFHQLIKEENFDLAEKILINYKDLAFPNLREYISLALEKGKFSFVKEAIETKKLDKDEVASLFKELIQKKEFFLVSSVLNTYEISKKDFIEGWSLAIDMHQYKWVCCLLRMEEINLEYFEGLFQKLIQAKQIDLALDLLAHREFSDYDLIEGIISAFEKQELQFIWTLMETDKLKESHYRTIGKRLAGQESLMHHLEWFYTTKVEIKSKASLGKTKLEQPSPKGITSGAVKVIASLFIGLALGVGGTVFTIRKEDEEQSQTTAIDRGIEQFNRLKSWISDQPFSIYPLGNYLYK